MRIGLLIVGDEILSGKRVDKHMPKAIELLEIGPESRVLDLGFGGGLALPELPVEYFLESLRQLLPFPVLTGLPFGHVARKVTLPFGAPGTLSIREKDYSLRFSGHLQIKPHSSITLVSFSMRT